MNIFKQIIFNLFLSAVFFFTGLFAAYYGVEYIIPNSESLKDGLFFIFLLSIFFACLKESVNILRFITLSWDERKIAEKDDLFWTSLFIGLFWNNKNK